MMISESVLLFLEVCIMKKQEGKITRRIRTMADPPEETTDASAEVVIATGLPVAVTRVVGAVPVADAAAEDEA